MSLTVVPFTAEQIADAGALVAAQHRRLREREPSLPERYGDPSAARELVAAIHADPATCGVAALRGDGLAGYLIAAVVLPNPESEDAVFIPPRSARVSYAGTATRAGDEHEVYRALYAALAPAWLARGCFWHDILLPADEPVALAAWHSLGFGLESLRAVRETGGPAAGNEPAGASLHLRFRRATAQDLDAVVRLSRGKADFHAGPPVFLPEVPESEAALRRYHAQRLTAADSAYWYWLAERDGAAVSMMAFEAATPAGTAVTPPESLYLAEAYTLANARGDGSGSALLRHALAWAHDAGYRFCAVSWDTPNIMGQRFWLRHGFRPVSARLNRLLDERIAWAQPSP